MTIGQLEERSEQIGQSLTATLDGVDRYQDDHTSGGQVWVDAEGNGRDPSAWRYWQWDAAIVLATDANLTAEQAADRMVEVLEDDGWVADEPRGGVEKAQLGFRRSDDLGEGWFAELAFRVTGPPEPQLIQITIVSPSTNRAS